MQIIPMYRYTRPDGGVSVSPVKPDTEYAASYRIVADEGKMVTMGGVKTYSCVDTDSLDGWYEVESTDIEEPVDADEVKDMRAALEVLGVEP